MNARVKGGRKGRPAKKGGMKGGTICQGPAIEKMHQGTQAESAAKSQRHAGTQKKKKKRKRKE